jgi:putative heme-binding domain-containing protein
MAQHEATPAQMITEGESIYRGACRICHGPNGDRVPGIHLGMGKFRRAYSDQELVQIILKGIPGTDMPPVDVSEGEARRILAYLRSTAAAAASSLPPGGDAGRGKAVFEGACATCHRVGASGSRLGPDLTDVGALRTPAELERSILDPGASVLPQHRFYRVVTRAGATVTGRLLQQDTFSVQLIDEREQLRSFSKADLREHGLIKTSPMPSYRGRLTSGEVADLVTYLFSLKGINQP